MLTAQSLPNKCTQHVQKTIILTIRWSHKVSHCNVERKVAFVGVAAGHSACFRARRNARAAGNCRFGTVMNHCYSKISVSVYCCHVAVV